MCAKFDNKKSAVLSEMIKCKRWQETGLPGHHKCLQMWHLIPDTLHLLHFWLWPPGYRSVGLMVTNKFQLSILRTQTGKLYFSRKIIFFYCVSCQKIWLILLTMRIFNLVICNKIISLHYSVTTFLLQLLKRHYSLYGNKLICKTSLLC